MQLQRFVSILLIVVSMLFNACSKKSKSDPTKVTQADVVKPATDITEAEAKEFGRVFAAALNKQLPVLFKNRLDVDGMFYRIFPKRVVDANRELKSAKSTWGARVGEQLFQNMNRTHVEVLRHFKDAEGTKIRFRMVGEGISYMDVLLSRNSAGKVRLVDYLDYVSGDTLSESQRRLFQQLMPGLISGKASQATAKEELVNVKNLKLLGSLFHSGQYNKFLDEYSRLSVRMRSQRSIMHLRVVAANSVAVERSSAGKATEGVYAKAVDEYRMAHPDASNLELLLLDYYFLKEEYKKVLDVVDQLDKRIGGDPYLNLLRGNAHYLMGDNEQALPLLRLAEKACPWDADIYNTQLEICIEEEDHPETTRVLIAMEENTDTEMDENFNGSEPFKAYRNSDEFPKWQAHVKKRGN